MSRIERIELRMVDLVPATVRTDAIQSFVSQETPIVRIRDSDGAEGIGYTYTIGTGGTAVMEMLSRYLCPRLLGRDPARVEEIWRDLHFHTHATMVGAITALALAAIDTALWDLRCRKAGLPLHVMAGGAQRRVPLYTTEGGWLHLPVEALVDDARRAEAAGFRGAKLKVGRTPREDRARLEAVRAATGRDFELMVDANQAFTVGDALRRAALLEPLDLAWFEEPMPADDVVAHARLAAGTRIPVAVGESLYSIGQFRDYLERGACGVVQVDVARIGGITPWLKVAHMAEAFDIPVSPHFLMEIHVSLSAAVPNGRWVEYIPQLDPITTSRMRIEDGHAVPPDEPGIGIRWDEAAVERLTVAGTMRTLAVGGP